MLRVRQAAFDGNAEMATFLLEKGQSRKSFASKIT